MCVCAFRVTTWEWERVGAQPRQTSVSSEVVSRTQTTPFDDDGDSVPTLQRAEMSKVWSTYVCTSVQVRIRTSPMSRMLRNVKCICSCCLVTNRTHNYRRRYLAPSTHEPHTYVIHHLYSNRCCLCPVRISRCHRINNIVNDLARSMKISATTHA